MKKLIVYDESCPMCKVYTKGMVLADGTLARVGNHELTNEVLLNQLDRQRARHEIPLLDLDGGATLYGVDTWAYAFGHNYPIISRLLSVGWLRAWLRTLYAFASFNRRIIISSTTGPAHLLDLQPDFRPDYRIAFVGLVLSLVVLLFNGIDGSIVPISILLGSQLTLVCLLAGLSHAGHFTETILDYAGHLGMSLLAGGLLVRLGIASGLPVVVSVGYALAIGQHFIRTHRLGLNLWPGICYSALVLVLLYPL